MWAIVLTYIFAAIWILRGGLALVGGALLSATSSSAGDETTGSMMAGVGFIAAMFGILHLCMGIGMLIKWSWVPIAVYIICGLGLLFSTLGLMMGVSPGGSLFSISINLLQIIVMAKTADLY